MDKVSKEFKIAQIRSLILVAKNVSVLLCHQYYSISFDRNFLKHADKVDIDEILDEFENWLNWIIIL